MTRVLAAIAQRLNRQAGAPAIPSLYFFTDPTRTPDPVVIAQRLPKGAAIVFRPFGATDALKVARALASIARKRGLILLIGADPRLAHLAKAHGVHLPARLAHQATRLKRQGALVTAAAHNLRELRQAQAAAAVMLSPIFPSRSPSAAYPLGAHRAGALARRSAKPVIALGGVTALNGKQLRGRGFAGLAAIGAFLEA